jgi:8-oxo-dGTP diphosphatase
MEEAPIRAPRIAAAAVVADREGRILMLRRAGDAPVGGNEWAIPGGKLDAGETLEACVVREVLEETGVEIVRAVLLPVITEDLAWGPSLHFVTHYFVATEWRGEARIAEPHKHVAVDWFDRERIAAAASSASTSDALFEPMAALVARGGLEAAARVLKAAA